jgi:Holliday junction resolvase RusA-like endonuclease
MIIVLRGDPRPNNHVYRSACRGKLPAIYLSPEGEKLKRDDHLEARSQWGRRSPLKGEVELWVTLYLGNKRKADIDNYHISLDGVTGVVYEYDSQIHALHVENGTMLKTPASTSRLSASASACAS